MISFFDTSALIKKYVHEAGSEFVRRSLSQSTTIAVSSTTRIECFSVIHRMFANDEMSIEEAEKLQQQVVEDFQFFEIVPFNDAVERLAVEIVQKHKLRTLDSIQLASSLSVNPNSAFFCFRHKIERKRKGRRPVCN